MDSHVPRDRFDSLLAIATDQPFGQHDLLHTEAMLQFRDSIQTK